MGGLILGYLHMCLESYLNFWVCTWLCGQVVFVDVVFQELMGGLILGY